MNLLPKTKVGLFVSDSSIAAAPSATITAEGTGERVDGKLTLLRVEGGVRVRPMEESDNPIQGSCAE